MDGPCLTPVPMYWNQSMYLIIIHMDRLMGLIGSSLKRAFCLTLTFSLWLLQWPRLPTGIITLPVKLISLSPPHDGCPALLVPVLFHLFFFTKEIVLYLCYHYPHSLITITLLCVLIHTYYISHPHHNCSPYISCLLGVALFSSGEHKELQQVHTYCSILSSSQKVLLFEIQRKVCVHQSDLTLWPLTGK